MTYRPTGTGNTGNEVSDRQARKEAIQARLDELGIVIDEGPLVIDPEKFAGAGTVWTCDSLQTMADLLDVAALTTDDPELFTLYAAAASMFQEAHDAQCP